MTNFLIGYPDIPLTATLLASPDAASGYSALSVVTGARSEMFRAASSTAAASWDFDLGSGVTRKPDYGALMRADLVDKADTGAVTFSLTGSAASNFSNPETKTADFGGSLIGSHLEDFVFNTPGHESAYRYWRATVASTASIQHAISKLYFGSWLDFGREPLYDAMHEKTVVERGNRFARYVVQLAWSGITDALRETFLDKIAKYKDVNPVILYDPGDCILNGMKVLHCQLTDFTFTPVLPNVNALAATFEEIN